MNTVDQYPYDPNKREKEDFIPPHERAEFIELGKKWMRVYLEHGVIDGYRKALEANEGVEGASFGGEHPVLAFRGVDTELEIEKSDTKRPEQVAPNYWPITLTQFDPDYTLASTDIDPGWVDDSNGTVRVTTTSEFFDDEQLLLMHQQVKELEAINVTKWDFDVG
jgi:hypothetical protein